MADFAKLPIERKVLAFVVAGMLLGLLYWQFMFKPLKADLDEAEGEHEAKIALAAKLEREIPEFEAMKKDIVKLRAQIAANDKALPTEAELSAFFDTLHRKINEAGVEETKWKQGQEVSVESFVRVPVDIEMTGTYMQIERFFASLVPKKKDKNVAKADQEEQDRIVSIESLALSNPVVRNREIVLTAKFTASTFRQEAKKLPPAAPGAAPGAPPPAPAPGPASAPAPAPAATPAAPPPLPPAATPAGAQIRVDNAMKKDEDRTRNAPTGEGSGSAKGGL